MKSVILCIALAFAAMAHAQTYTLSVIYGFPQLSDGSADSPGSLIIDSSGILYTTACCSSTDFGSVIKITPAGEVTTLYTFTGGKDGGMPIGLVRDSSGNLYGLTSSGGSHGCGTIFKLTPSLKETTLYSFNNVHPFGSLLRDLVGNFYGYVVVGTSTHQRMFKLTSGGTYSTVHTFCSQADCTDGVDPVGNPIVDKSGNFYGMTHSGGAFNFGAVFKLTPSFKFSVLYNFAGGADGAYPTGKLTQNASGVMYGTASSGGVLDQEGQCEPPGCGTVFQITSSSKFTLLHTFTNTDDGFSPIGAVTLDSAGNLYGITDDLSTGIDFAPFLFKISPQGTFTAVSTMSAAIPGVAVDKSGNIFGSSGNNSFDGTSTIYELARTD